jgi:hypothetical protein
MNFTRLKVMGTFQLIQGLFLQIIYITNLDSELIMNNINKTNEKYYSRYKKNKKYYSFFGIHMYSIVL